MNEKIHRIMKSKKKKKKSACKCPSSWVDVIVWTHTDDIPGQRSRDEEGRKEGTRLRYPFRHFRAPCPPHKTNV